MFDSEQSTRVYVARAGVEPNLVFIELFLLLGTQHWGKNQKQ
jgi:hypothetical protein